MPQKVGERIRERKEITPNEALVIVRDAYIYGFPMVDSYGIQYSYLAAPDNPEYKAPWNEICNIARVFTLEDKAVQTTKLGQVLLHAWNLRALNLDESIYFTREP